MGARKEKGSARYPVEPVVVAHGAGVPDESIDAGDRVYASLGEPAPGPAPDIFAMVARCRRRIRQHAQPETQVRK